jgi:hypothetical protein
MCKFLVESGLNLRLSNKLADTPFDIAMKMNRKDIALICQWGGMGSMARSAMRRRKFSSLMHTFRKPLFYLAFLLCFTNLIIQLHSLSNELFYFSSYIHDRLQMDIKERGDFYEYLQGPFLSFLYNPNIKPNNAILSPVNIRQTRGTIHDGTL